jgi:sigma-B regulation protein RsbU (phosphoserine phosphatase)
MKSPIRVLLVDDDPVFTTLTCELLKAVDAGGACQVRTVGDGTEALKAVHQRPYDLALLDYNLPGANGLEVLSEIQSLPPARQPAVIMLTAEGNESLAVEAMKRGARDYLTKANVDLASLTRAVQSAMNQKRLTEQLEAYNAQLEADLEMARKLQQSLLPQEYPSFAGATASRGCDLRFHHRFFYTTQLGGDFFSVQALSEHQAGVFICDVMGHGVRSALVTSMLRALVGDLTAEARQPDRFLSGMNRRLTDMLKQTGDTLFATALYVVVDLGAGQLRYARAGHPPALHLRTTEAVVEPLPFPKRAGPALGLFGDAEFVACERRMAPGDLLLLYTDGLVEVTGEQGEEFGESRLREAARTRLGRPLVNVVDGLVDDVRAFAGTHEFPDDVCLLGVEMAPRSETLPRDDADEENSRR